MAEDNSFAGQGSVVLDIGGDIGALIVTMPAAMEGVEIEIRPVGAIDQRPQVQAADGAPPVDAHGHHYGHDYHAHDGDHTHDDDHAHDDDHTSGHAHGRSHSHDPSHSHDHAAFPPSPWPHVAVVGRRAPVGIIHCAVYPQLRAGSYELYERPAGPVRMVADVVGGTVTEATWPS